MQAPIQILLCILLELKINQRQKRREAKNLIPRSVHVWYGREAEIVIMNVHW